MFQQFKIFVLLFLSIIIFDLIWFYLTKKIYLTHLYHLIDNTNGKLQVNYIAVLIVYFLCVLGIMTFVLPKAHQMQSAFLYGCLFGLVIYGIYNFTNFAILNWPKVVLFIDIVWGCLLCGTVSLIGFYIHHSNNTSLLE